MATVPEMLVDICYAAPQAHRIVNVALHREYSLDIKFTVSQGRKCLYHVYDSHKEKLKLVLLGYIEVTLRKHNGDTLVTLSYG
jgi:hypothetical protein